MIVPLLVAIQWAAGPKARREPKPRRAGDA
jgi:hypothetical protein